MIEWVQAVTAIVGASLIMGVVLYGFFNGAKDDEEDKEDREEKQ